MISPDELIMLIVAVLIDISGFLLLCFGLDDFGFLDIFGLGTIGVWLFLKTGDTSSFQKKSAVSVKEKRQVIVSQLAKRGRKRILKTFLVEVIPIIGSLVPTWIITVVREIKNKNK